MKRVRGGLLVQDPDRVTEDARGDGAWPPRRSPSEEQWADLLFAWKVCRHVRSNAIVFARDGATLGIGAGQMSRVDSVRIAIEKAREARGDEADGLLAGLGPRLRRVLPLPRRPPAGDRRRSHVVHPAGRLEARRRGRRGGRRGRRRDGLHRPPPLPPLASAPAREHPGLDVVRVFCDEDDTGGNPLGVFLDGREIPEADRQPIAAELGFAETVFVDDRERGAMRIFTPTPELPLAGHPLVGTAWLLRERGTAPEVLRPRPARSASASTATSPT